MGQKVVIRARFPSVDKTAKSLGVSHSRLQKIEKLMDGIIDGRTVRVVKHKKAAASPGGIFTRGRAAPGRKYAMAKKKKKK